MWNCSGHWYESCSCKMNCRCTLGAAEPDQEWCSGAQLYEIAEGSADGTSLAGVRMAVLLDLPGDFVSGVIDRARLYFDPAVNDAQRDSLEAIFQGRKGGPWAAFAPAIREWIPSKVTPINVKVDGETITTSIDGVGGHQLTWLKTADGRQARLVNAPVMAAFEVDNIDLADAVGSRWNDPEMRSWESLGFGGQVEFSWKG